MPGYKNVVNDRWLKFAQDTVDRATAEANCAADNAFLATLDEKEIFDEIDSAYSAAGQDKISNFMIFFLITFKILVWSGLKKIDVTTLCLDAACNGLLTWYNGEAFDFTTFQNAGINVSDFQYCFLMLLFN